MAVTVFIAGVGVCNPVTFAMVLKARLREM